MVSGAALVLNPPLSVEDAFVLYSQQVVSMAYGYIHDWDKADDVAQQVWENACKAWSRFDGRNPLGWLRTIARNVAINEYRGSERDPIAKALDVTSYAVQVRAPSVDGIDAAADRLDSTELLQQLSDEDRQILSAAAVAVSSKDAVGLIKGRSGRSLSVGYYRVLLCRARKRLRELAAGVAVLLLGLQ